MPSKRKSTGLSLSAAETVRVRDEALRRAMNTPPTPHKAKEKGAETGKPARRLPASRQDRKNRRQSEKD
jgi:hypothetical protein